MSDGVKTIPGTGTDPTVDTDEVTRGGETRHQQVVKLSLGLDGASDLLVDSGQQTMVNSVPVVIASDQSPVAVDATPASPAATDYLPVRLTDGTAFYSASGGGGGGGDGAINDGVSSAIKATVLDYVNSNPLAVRLTDTNGDYVGAGAGTQYVEDVAAAADPTGTMMMAVRADALAAVTDTDGDNIAARATNKGELYVKHADTLPVSAASLPLPTGAATFAEQQTQTTALQLLDDVVHSGDAALSKYAVIGAQFDDTTPGTVTEDNARALRMTSSRGLHANLRNASGTEIGTAGAPVRMDPTGTTTQPVSAASLPLPTGAATAANQSTEITALQLIDDAIVADNAAFTDGTTKLDMAGFVFDETAGTALTENDAAAARIDSKRALVLVIEDETTRGRRATVTAANALKVDGSAVTQPVSGTVTANLAAGTNNIGDVDIASAPTGASAIQVQGTAAHDAATAGNPVLNGGQMETMADSAPGTRAGTDGDAVKAAMTDGAQFVVTTGPQTWSYHVDGSSALTDATVHAAPGAGLSLYVQTIVVSLGAATAINVFFEEGASKVLGPYYLEAVNGRTLVINFTSPKKITANTALTVTSSAAVAHAIDVTGFIAPG